MTVGIQLADYVAGTLREFFDENLHIIPSSDSEKPHIQKLREYYQIIQKRTSSFGPMTGMYIAPDDFLEKYYT